VSVDVQKLKEENVDMITPCMDQNGVLTLAKEMRRQGIQAPFWLPMGYDHEFMAEYGDLFEGSYVRTRFAPFEWKPESEGMKLFNKWMDKTGKTKRELAMVGWIDADMFVEGLRRAGPNFTRQKVVNELNKLTDYDAKGILPGLDWTIQHKDPHVPENRTPQDCFAISKIVNKKFEPAFTQSGKPFICLPTDPPEVPEHTNKA
jgi:hypothetical protein